MWVCSWSRTALAIERSFLYVPERALVTRPVEIGLVANKVWLQAADGVQLHGCWLPGRGERVLFGHSLGAAVALEVGRLQPAGAIILETPFLSVPTLARTLCPWVPSVVVRSRFDNAAKCRQVPAPKLIVHGDKDEVVSEALRAACGCRSQ